MTTFMLVMMFTFGDKTMAIQSPSASLDQCKKDGVAFLQEYEKGIMGEWQLQYIDCHKQTAI